MGETIEVCVTHTKQDVSFSQMLCLEIEMGMKRECFPTFYLKESFLMLASPQGNFL